MTTVPTRIDADNRIDRWSVRHLYLLIPWIAIGFSALKPVNDNSFLWHIRAGAVQLDIGEVLRADPFSATFGGEPCRTQSWLVELFYGWMDKRVGLSFVPVWVAVVAVGVCVGAGVRLGAHRREVSFVATGLVMFAWLGAGYFAPRPVLISYLWMAVLVLSIASPRSRWATPLILWLWAATHGSFILGLGYLLLEAIRVGKWRLARLALFGAFLASITAHGWHVWEILWRFAVNRDALDLIVEWAPPKVLDPVVAPFVFGVGVLLFHATRGRIESRDLWVIAPFLMYGLTSYRALMPAMIVILPWMVPWLPASLNRSEPVNRAVFVVVVGAILVLPFVMFGNAGSINDETFPVGAAGHLRNAPALHDDSVGGFLIYSKWPEIPVYVDDRAELYGSEFLGQLGYVLSGSPVWQDEVEQWNIEQALLKVDDRLVRALEEAGWQETYRDQFFVVLSTKK